MSDAIDKGKDLRNGFVDFRRDLLVEVEARQDFDEILVLAYGNVVGFGDLDETLGHVPASLGSNLRGAILAGLIAEGYNLERGMRGTGHFTPGRR